MPTAHELNEEPDPEAARIGALLRSLREAHHQSLAQVGANLGRAHSFLSKIERGHAKPATQLALVPHLARIYGITTDAILHDLFPDGVVNVIPGVELALTHRKDDE
ncbi:helix-turn-helix domain-containing protein [Actinomadura sp. GTD37]|uniref:helix-turn-helix domain-containing protein n=1 Tax=Actinomadura sp. GTD37 TaxID=1778030 RepID=UPI0035BEDF09